MLAIATAIVACGKKNNKESQLGAYGLAPETTAYEVQCNPPPPPANPSGGSAMDPMSVPLPDNLPTVQVQIDVQSCSALAGQPPHFYFRTMPGFAAVIDCKTRVVRFKTHDWQITEGARMGPTGDVEADIMLIARLTSDSVGNENCWSRFLGHVSGHVDCGGDPNAARFDFTTKWRFDETPPEVMEPASAGQADLRNGKHCVLRPGNCYFSNTASVGCGG